MTIKRIIDRDGYTLLDPLTVEMRYTERSNGRGISHSSYFWAGVTDHAQMRFCPQGGDIHGLTFCPDIWPIALGAMQFVADLAREFRFQQLRAQFPNLEEPPIGIAR